MKNSGIVVILLLLVVSSVVAGLVYWKRNDLFGSKVNKACKDKDLIGCKPGLECVSGTCKVPEDGKCESDFECSGALTCTDNVCKEPEYDPVDCQGNWVEDLTANCEQIDTSVTCGVDVAGRRRKKFNKTVSQAHGGNACPTWESLVSDADKYSNCTVTLQQCVTNPLENGGSSGGSSGSSGGGEQNNDHPTEPVIAYDRAASSYYPVDNYYAEIFKFVNGERKCLRVKNGDSEIGYNDDVELGSCDPADWGRYFTNDSHWQIYSSNNRIKTKNVTNRSKQGCLDFNDNQSAKKMKVTDCTGNPQSNRDFRFKNHDKLVWDSERTRVTLNNQDDWRTKVIPVKIQFGNPEDNRCLNDPNQREENEWEQDTCYNCVTDCNAPGTEWYVGRSTNNFYDFDTIQ